MKVSELLEVLGRMPGDADVGWSECGKFIRARRAVDFRCTTGDHIVLLVGGPDRLTTCKDPYKEARGKRPQTAEQATAANKVLVEDHGNVFGTGHWYLFYCPSCRRSVRGRQPACANCGTALDWPAEKEARNG